MNTKERIIEEALRLFSEKGYGGVSVRDIAGAVGIKESSLYNHFRNKQDIFDSIVEDCFGKAKLYFESRELPFGEEDDIGVFAEKDWRKLTDLIVEIFTYFFEDSCNMRFRRLLLVSQYENERCRDIYRKLYRDYPVEFQTRIFRMLMENGQFRKEDPESVAREFYGVMFLLMHTFDSMAEARPAVEEHVRQFIKNYQISCPEAKGCGRSE